MRQRRTYSNDFGTLAYTWKYLLGYVPQIFASLLFQLFILERATLDILPSCKVFSCWRVQVHNSVPFRCQTAVVNGRDGHQHCVFFGVNSSRPITDVHVMSLQLLQLFPFDFKSDMKMNERLSHRGGKSFLNKRIGKVARIDDSSSKQIPNRQVADDRFLCNHEFVILL